MTFQPGNRFWMARSSQGPKPKFATPDDLQTACFEYFEWVAENPLYEAQLCAYQGSAKIEHLPKMRAMTIEGLCIFLGINRRTWERYPEVNGDQYSDVKERVESIIRTQKFEGAAAGILQPNIIARDLGLKEQTSNEHTGKNGAPIETVNMTIDQFKKAAEEVAQKF